MSFNFRQNGSWVQGTRYKRENRSWVPLGSGSGGGGGTGVGRDPSAVRSPPSDATTVYADGGTVYGETDGGSTYTASSLPNLLEDLSSNTSTTIAIESDTYTWSDMCTIESYTDILGVGDVTLDVQNMGNNPCFDLYDVTDDVTIENFIFESDGTTDDAISRRESRVPRKDGLHIRHNVFRDFTGENSSEEDVHVINADNWYDGSIEHCEFINTSRSGIRHHAGGEGFNISNCYFDIPPSCQQAIMTDAHQTTIEGCHIKLNNASGDNSYAIRIQDRWADFDKDITLDNNTIEAVAGSTDSHGVYSATNLLDVLDITNNTFYGLDLGVSGDLPSDTDIIGNTFDSCRVGVTSSGSTNINLSDNTFIDSDTDVDL